VVEERKLGCLSHAFSKQKAVGFRDGGGNGEYEGNVVGGAAKLGRKGGVGEGGTERVVEECSVQPSERGGVPLVRPSVEVIKEGEFERDRPSMRQLNLLAREELKLGVFLSVGERVRLKSPMPTQLMV